MFGMGHREFAKFTGFDESTILHWENGYSRPSIHSVDKLSSICGIDIAYKPDEIYNPYERKSGSFSRQTAQQNWFTYPCCQSKKEIILQTSSETLPD
jgi:transcriptional regulator with XRE-family HTH domain